jgi:hypothetical protein
MTLASQPQPSAHQPVFTFKGFDDWFPIFRAGEQTDSKGKTRKFTVADLQSIVGNHNADDPSPLCVGHPELNDPAYGWTTALKEEDGTLFAKARPTVDEFAEAVEKELYPNRSISIEPDDKGGWKLRHIGFLGAKKPAVEGMARLKFESNPAAIEFTFMGYGNKDSTWLGVKSVLRDMKSMLRSVRDYFIEKDGVEKTNQSFPDWRLDSIDRQIDTIGHDFAANDTVQDLQGDDLPGNANPNTEFTMDEKQKMQQQLDDAQKQIDTLNAANKKMAAEHATAAFSAQLKDAQATVDGLLKAGKLLPAQKTGLAMFMASLPADAEASFEFASGDNKTEKKTPAEFFAEFLAKLGKQITLGAHDDEDVDDPEQHYAAPAGTVISPERAALHQKALNYQAKNGGEYVAALNAVSKAV